MAVALLSGCVDGQAALPGLNANQFAQGRAPAAKAAPKGVPPAAKNPQAANPSNQPKSRLVRAMLQVLEDHKDEGTAEEHQQLREMLLNADDEIDRSLGGNLADKIRDVNERNGVSPIRRLTPEERQALKSPSTPPAPETTPPANSQPSATPPLSDPFAPPGGQ